MTMFADCFEAHADRPCLHAAGADGERRLSYAETLDLGRRLTTGLAPRSLVVLRCALTPEAIAAYCALLVDGHVPLLLEDDLAPDLFESLVETYRPNAILDPREGLSRQRDDAPELHPDLGLLLTTSGSTGSPKLVRHGAAGIRANAEAIVQYLGLTEEERPLLHLPMSYSFGMSVINSHLVAGACICPTGHTVMEPGYWDDLRRVEATSIAGVVFHYQVLRRFAEKQLDLPHLRTLTQAGGRLDPKLVAWFADWALRTGRKFYVMYGQTEAGPRIAYLPPDMALSAPDAVGVPIPGVSIALRDEGGAEVADGAAGEMIVRGPSVMLGYAETAGDLAKDDERGGELATGDVSRMGEDGLLRIVGRRSRILKVYGLRLNMDEVEKQLTALGFPVLCFGEDDALRILLESDGEPGTLKDKVTEMFSIPPRGVEVRATDEVPRAASGKVRAVDLDAAWERARR